MSIEQKHEKMVELLAKSGQEILDGLTPDSIHSLHMAVGISGEAAELAEAIFELGRKDVVEEIGDLLFYVVGLSRDSEIKARVFDGSSFSAIRENGLTYVIQKLQNSAGFLLDAVKKQSVYCKPLDAKEASDQLSTVVACVNRICYLLVISRVECLEANMEKLLTGKNARYKEGIYTDEQAQQRNDKTGES